MRTPLAPPPKISPVAMKIKPPTKKHDPSIQVVPINVLSSLTFSMRKEPLLYKNIGYC